MIKLIEIIIFILLVIGSNNLLDGIYRIPHKKAKEVSSFGRKKKTIAEKYIENLVVPLANQIKKFINLGQEEKQRFELKLKSVGIDLHAEDYYARGIANGIYALSFPVIFFVIGMNGFIIVGIGFSVYAVYYSFMTYERKGKKKEQEIKNALPSFVRSIIYKLDGRNNVIKADLISIFEDYLKVANPVFAYDVSVLIMEMKSKEIESALRNFAQRLQIAEIFFLCNALIGLTRGEYQTDTLNALAREMDTKARDMIKKELETRPKKVIKACIPLFIIALIAIMYVLIVAMTQGIATLS